MQSRRFLSIPKRCWLLAVCSLCGLSCSSGAALNPVKGKVLYKNKPLSGALVSFHPKEKKGGNTTPPTALTKEDGTFSVNTGEKTGAPAGEYIVTIICSEVPSTSGKKVISTGGIETRDRLKGAYANRATSKIHVVIKKGINQLEPFNLK